MSWRWDKFVVYCIAMLFAGWGSGFICPMWLAVVLGGLVGLLAGVLRWFEVNRYS